MTNFITFRPTNIDTSSNKKINWFFLNISSTFRKLFKISFWVLISRMFRTVFFFIPSVAYIYILIHADAMITDAVINDARRTSLTTYSPLTLFVRFEKVVQGLHVRGCWRLNINFIFWPHCYDRHVVSLLFSWCWGLLHQGVPSAPSVGCGFPYHIWSLLSGILLATASGVSAVPLGRVWPSLPHLVSNSLGVCWQLLWDPNSTELNNNSTPTRSPTGSLKSNV